MAQLHPKKFRKKSNYKKKKKKTVQYNPIKRAGPSLGSKAYWAGPWINSNRT
jgi:hypothetical protein